MTLDKKAEKLKRVTIGRRKKIQPMGGRTAPQMVAEIAERSSTLSEVADRVKQEYDIDITIPTVTSYLKAAWGKKYAEKKKDMSARRREKKRWDIEYGLARQNIGDVFKEDWLSTDDGLFYNFNDSTLVSLPRVEDRAYRSKNIINYSKAGDFGWTPDREDPEALGTADQRILGIVTRQLNRRIDGQIEERKRALIREKAMERLKKMSPADIEIENLSKIIRENTRIVKKELSEEIKALEDEKADIFVAILQQLGKGDARTRSLHGRDMIQMEDGKLSSLELDPAYASSDKKYRGRQRMLTMPDEVFSRVTNNIPFILWCHPKRIQVHGHNLAKEQPELLNPEPPKVPARYNDVPGINARVRFPKNLKEYVHTQEAGMIVTKAFAEKFRYFTVVEEGMLIVEDLSRFPKAWRVNTAIKNHTEYKRIIDMAEDVYPIDRLDPLTLGGFEEIGYGVGNKFAKHSGELFLVGQPKKRRRKITLAQGESGKEKDHVVDVEYYSQRYQIVREDALRVGDKLLDRHGIKGIISEIVDNLGRNDKRESYDLIVNYDEVWREADRSTSEGLLQDDTFIKQGKKKSGIVMEHEAGDGQIFFFLIDKFAQDGTTTGLRFSPTLVNGLWERALDTLEDDTVYNRDALIDSFASSYFRGEGNLVSTLKALHYKAVKENGVVRIEIDDREPTPDEGGDVVNLPHTYAGHTYNTAYVPFSVARVYHDGKTFREIYIAQQANTPNDASDFYWFNIMKQTKNRFNLFPKMDWGIQLVTRPWAEDPKDPTKYHKVQMDYLDVIDMGGDPYDPNLKVTFRKEPVTSGDSIQTHPVEVDLTGKTRSTIGLNPTIGLKATIDYDGDQVVVFVPAITDAVSTLNKEELAEVKALKKVKFNETFEGLYDKARNITYAGSEEELGVGCAAFNQQIAETENELIERLGGLRKRAMILQSKELPPIVTIGEGTKYEEQHSLDIAMINKITDVEKILKMREPRWKVRKIEKRKIEDLSPEEWELVRDSYLRKKLNKIINIEIKDPGVRKLYDLIREPSEYMQREFMGKSGEIDPIGLKLDTRSRLLDRILWNEIKTSDIYVDLDAI